MNFPKFSDTLRIEKLLPASGRIRVVIDTDTYNEIDDQFAVVHALLSPQKLAVEGLYAAPFFNQRSRGPKEGMQKSYDELLRLMDKLDVPSIDLVHLGSPGFLENYENPFTSDVTDDLIERAMKSDEPLYVIAVGALTNIASAILIEPRIIEKIILVWLGGNALHWPHTIEFNLAGDVMAARLVLDCGVPMVLIPCAGVTSHLHTTVAEIEAYVQGRGRIGTYLAEVFKSYNKNHFGWSKEIWDVAAVAYLLDERWIPSQLVSSPIIAQQASSLIHNVDPFDWQNHRLTWSFDHSRHQIRCAYFVDRDPIFQDLFTKLNEWANGKIEIVI